MRGDEEGRFARKVLTRWAVAGDILATPEKISIHLNAVDYTEDLALDNVQHVLPDLTVDLAQACSAILGGLVGYMCCCRCKPNFQ